METKDPIVDILITGAGPAGLTLSLLLAGAGFSVVLLDAEKPAPIDKNKPSGRTAALLNSSINVIKATGIWPDIADYKTPLKTMRIVDDGPEAKDRIGISFHAKDVGEEQFGFNIPNNLLKAALHHKVQSTKNIQHIAPSRLTDYQIDGPSVLAKTEDGKSIRAAVIIGTDGRGSIVRAVSGIDAKKYDYTQTAMTCLIAHSKPHDFTATEFHRPGGPFTLVPMPGNQSSVVWVEKTQDSQRYLSMKRDAFVQAVQDRTHGIVGEVSLISDPESWPLILLNSHELVGDRCALAAEAAHVMSPIGAQGLNLSLRDVAALAETLTDAARLGEDIGSILVLSRYQRRRSLDIKSHVVGIDGLNRAVANDIAAIKDLRRLGLKTMDKIPPLKQFVMKQGLVPSLDKGRLVSGKPL